LGESCIPQCLDRRLSVQRNTLIPSKLAAVQMNALVPSRPAAATTATVQPKYDRDEPNDGRNDGDDGRPYFGFFDHRQVVPKFGKALWTAIGIAFLRHGIACTSLALGSAMSICESAFRALVAGHT